MEPAGTRAALRAFYESVEARQLAPYAARSAEAARAHAEKPSAERTEFARDRDRVIHSAAFRRLQNKTQVYAVYEGDFYRTRLTHTLEVSQVARSLARVLRANETLTEAVALAHDLGHPPFGHQGEFELDMLMKGAGKCDGEGHTHGYEQNRQSVRIVTVLERIRAEFSGLNLTLDALYNLSKRGVYEESPLCGTEGWNGFITGRGDYPALEGQIVDLADEIAYSVHDLEDGLAVGLLDRADIESIGRETPVVREAFTKAVSEGKERPGGRPVYRAMTSILIHHFLADAIAATGQGLEQAPPEDSAGTTKERYARLSDGVAGELATLKAFLHDRVYNNRLVLMSSERGRRVVRELFTRFTDGIDTVTSEVRISRKRPQARGWMLLPGEERALLSLAKELCAKRRVVADYIGGMTDRYANLLYRNITGTEESTVVPFR